MAKSKNFIFSPADTIRRIRDTLSRYPQADRVVTEAEKLSAIVKELVQNSEDAEAHRLFMAWTPQLPSAEHAWLQGPGLVVINDGRFEPAKDGRAIRRFGLNSKAADATSIGKFGLGLKSVFHLAEVFFFNAVDERGAVLDADVLNPWSDESGGLHPDWDEFSSGDQDRMRYFARSLCGEGRYFCLWLPLRRREPLGKVDPIIQTREFPGEREADSLLCQVTPEHLAPLLPMLSHLREISVWTVLEQGPQLRFSVKVDDKASRRTALSALEKLPSTTPRRFAGQTTGSEAASERTVVFCGHEQRRDDAELASVAASGLWPRDLAIDEETGRDTRVREKAIPHAAVCFVATRSPAASRDLTLHDVNTMFFWDTSDKLLAIVVNVSCPSQEVESNRLLSSDFWGPTREMLQEEYGQDVTIVGLCGAAGDQSPHLRYRQAADDRMRSLRKLDRLQEIARRIVHGVAEAYEVVQTAKQDDVVVKHRYAVLRLPQRIVTEAEYQAGKAEAERLKAHPGDGRGNWNARVVARYEKLAADPQPTHATPINVLRIGDPKTQVRT